jgi:VWFA-related protein
MSPNPTTPSLKEDRCGKELEMIMGRISLVTLLTVLLAVLNPTISLTEEPETTFTEQIEVNLVDLKVVVTSFWGRPVTNLTRDDFEIWEDGERREISHFALVTDGAVDGAAELSASLASGATSSGTAQPATALDRSIILAFDSAIDRPYFRRAVKAARDFVAQHSGDRIWWSVVVLAAQPHSLLPLTNDAREVVETLDSLLVQNAALRSRFRLPAPPVPRSPYLEGPWCRLVLTEQSLSYPYAAHSLSEIFRAYASVPGAKACVIYKQGSGGYFFASAHGLLQMRRHIDLWLDLGRQASSAGFRVYTMDVRGLNYPFGGTADGNISAATPRPSGSIGGGPIALAYNTGGAAYALNHLDEALEAAARETGTYYSMAFVAPHDHDGRAHHLEVKVPGRRWLQVRHSSGFYDVDPRTLLVEHLAAPAHFPKDGGSLPLTLEVSSRAGEDELDLTATAKTPAESLTLVPQDGARVAEVDLFVAVHDSTGALVSLKQEQGRVRAPTAAEEVELSVPLHLQLSPGRYTLSVALYDPVSDLSGIATARIDR